MASIPMGFHAPAGGIRNRHYTYLLTMMTYLLSGVLDIAFLSHALLPIRVIRMLRGIWLLMVWNRHIMSAEEELPFYR